MRHILKSALALCTIATMVGAAHAQASDPTTRPLKPGDRIQITIWADTAIEGELIVDERGSVTLPRLGNMSVAGVPAQQLGDSVRKAYGRILLPVAVEVIPLRRVTVSGDVFKPNTLFLETRSTIRDAVARAGGVTELGRENPVLLLRDATELRLKGWSRRGDAETIVHSGDAIIVLREPWIKRNVFSIISGLGIVASLILTTTR
ncbi:MAG: polysaccharide biosynthesis/export family protein [Gemmatimonadetes bacterium]|nr:polysaccharide biosynthesis/export family protein [Gemmatimonadota bacterium]